MRSVWNELMINHFLEESFTSSMGEKEKTLSIASLIRSIGFTIKFIMKLSSLVTLMSFIVFNDSFGVKNHIY